MTRSPPRSGSVVVTAWCLKQDIKPPLVLKVGVHHGPAIAMTANGRLDYFGRTVNLAARIADSSRGGDVVMLRQVLDEADRSFIDGRVTTESFTTRLRGIDDDQYLVRLAVTDANRRQQPREAS